jgi:uncharacterized protein YqjF (DUF2071 family)
VTYRCLRTARGAASAELDCRYRPVGAPFLARRGSLEHFLTARDCLYASHPSGALRRGDIDHAPWPLRAAEWRAQRCDMTRLLGFDLPGSAPHLLFADRLDVRAWLPVRC